MGRTFLTVAVSALFLVGCASQQPSKRTSAKSFSPTSATLSAAAASTMRVHFINVGQGDATLIEFPCAAMLVDAGGETSHDVNSGALLMAYLEAFFDRRKDLNRTLALFVLTHPHKDHTLNVPMVLSRYKIRNALDNGLRKGSGRFGQVALQTKAKQDASMQYRAVRLSQVPNKTGLTGPIIDPIACNRIDPRISVLWGQIDKINSPFPKIAKEPNNHSLVLRIEFGKATVLLTGDLEHNAIPELLKKYSGTDALRAMAFQAGHHGSANGITTKLANAVSPSLTVISMGPPLARAQGRVFNAWDFGHPRRSHVSLLAKAMSSEKSIDRKGEKGVLVCVANGQRKFVMRRVKKPIYATGWDGNVVATFRSNGSIKVTTQFRKPTVGRLCRSGIS